MSYSHRVECERLQHALREAVKRAEAAEAKQASNIIYQVRLLDGGENSLEWVEVTEEEFNTPTTEKYGKWEHRKLYTRPASATDLAEIVPEDLNGKSMSYIADKFQVSISEAQFILVGFNACRTATLRNIEEAK